MMTDPIADMLTRIRNAYLVHKKEAAFPFSKVKMAITEILVREGYLAKAEITEDKHPHILVTLKYNGKEPAINNLKRISKPGSRFYIRQEQIGQVLGGYGLAILSTSHGILTDKDAKKLKIGGEMLCEIY